MRNITRTARMIVGGVALLAGLLLPALLGLAAVVIPAVLGILAIELSRAARFARRAPAPAWRKIPNSKA
jgi:hypothetical protein